MRMRTGVERARHAQSVAVCDCEENLSVLCRGAETSRRIRWTTRRYGRRTTEVGVGGKTKGDFGEEQSM